jgi:F0F1-type ATP synthase membrane subunit a
MKAGYSMQETEHGHHHEVHIPRPYWQRAHKDWRFWVAFVFIFAALFIYITTVDLSLVPRRHQHSVPISQ